MDKSTNWRTIFLNERDNYQKTPKVAKNLCIDVILKSYEMNEEIFKKFGFDESIIDSEGVTVAKPKQRSTRDLLISFIDTQLKFNKKVDKNFKSVNKHLKSLDDDMKLIKSLPTIKAELKGEEHVPKWAQKLIKQS